MKTKIIRNAAFAALVITASAVSAHAADLKPFVRVEATYTDTGYDSNFPSGYELGAAVTAGVYLVPQHELSLNIGYTQWETAPAGLAGVTSSSLESEQIPVLLNYRYHVETSKGFSFYVGPSVGFIYEKATGNVTLNTGVPGLKPVGTYDDEAFKFAFGGTIGASYAINDGWKVTASAQVLRVSSEDYDLIGSTGKSPYDDATRIGFSLGLSYRW